MVTPLAIHDDTFLGQEKSDPGSLSSGSLRRLQAREPDAWRRMAANFIPLVYGWVMRTGLQADDAADIVQEVFRAVAGRIDDFRRETPQGSFRRWLRAITRNKIGDYIRQGRRAILARGGSDAMMQLLEVPNAEDADGEEAQEFGELCQRALAGLRSEFHETTWQAFWRVVVEDRPAAQVADELGLTLNAVYLAKSRILRRLREEIGEGDV